MSWMELSLRAPTIAHVGRRLLESAGVAFLATVRKDGSPRVHPVCPLVVDDRLMLGIIDSSPKHADLLRDPRCVLHALPGPGNTEFWVEATAWPEPLDVAAAWAAREPRLNLPAGDTLFRLDLTAAHATIFQPDGKGHPVPDRRHWRCTASVAGAGLVGAGSRGTR